MERVYTLLTANRGTVDHFTEHPLTGPGWRTTCEMDDGNKVGDDRLQVLSPEDKHVAMFKLAECRPSMIRDRINADMEAGGFTTGTASQTQPAAPSAPAKPDRPTYTGTTGNERLAEKLTNFETDKFSLTVTHGAQFPADYVQIMAPDGRVVGNIVVEPLSTAFLRITKAVREHAAAARPGSPAVQSSTPPAPKASETLPARTGQDDDRPADKLIRYVPVGDVIDGDNIRDDMGDLDGLAADIRRRGIRQPLTVRPKGDKFEVEAGHRRLAAARLAGLKFVPCIAEDDDDQQALEWMISENTRRKDLSPIEEAKGYQRLTVKLGTHEEIAKAVGCSRVRVTEYLQLLELPSDLQFQVATGILSVKAGIEFVRRTKADAEPVREQVAAGLIAERPSAREAETVIERLRNEAGAAPRPPKREDPAPGTAARPEASQSAPRLPEGPAHDRPAVAPQPPAPPAPATAPPQPAEPVTTPPAPAPAARLSDAEIRSASLADIGRQSWQKWFGDAATGERLYTREVYCPLPELVEHFHKRAQLGANVMPATTGKSVLEIPEQRVWISGWSELAHTAGFELQGTELAVTVPTGGVRGTYVGSPVYYRIELASLAGADNIGLYQQVIIQDGGRHIVVTGVSNASIGTKQCEQWKGLLEELPAAPSAAPAAA